MSNLDKQLIYAYWIKIDGEPNEVRTDDIGIGFLINAQCQKIYGGLDNGW
jgi:hypothetical protein